MLKKEIKNFAGKVIIDVESDISIFNSDVTIEFDMTVGKAMISSIIDSNVIFVINSSIEIASTNMNISAKNDIKYELFNKGTNLLVRDISYVKNSNKLFQKVLISHNTKQTFCNYMFLGFSFDEATLDIAANNWIKKDMSGSESHQLLKVITDGNGKARTEPGLIIDNYDVKASHGNSIGQFDPLELYYLESRGIDEFLAKKIIIEGKIENALNSFDSEYSKRIKTSILDGLGVNYG